MSAQAKIVLLGAAGAGKSAIMLRLVNDRFDPHSTPTIGAAYATYRLETGEGPRFIGIWDTAGQERYSALAPMYYRNAQLALVVHDITSVDSFERAKGWIKTLTQQKPDMRMLLVGTKSDLDGVRVVERNTAIGLARLHSHEYLELSAKTGHNFDELRSFLVNTTRSLPTSPPINELPFAQRSERSLRCCR